MCVEVSENMGTPHIIHLNWIFHYKQSILGHHHFRKPHIYLRKPNLLGFGVGPPLCSTNLANKVGDHLVERMDWFNCYSFHGCFRMEECPRMIHVFFFGALIGWGSDGGVFEFVIFVNLHSCLDSSLINGYEWIDVVARPLANMLPLLSRESKAQSSSRGCPPSISRYRMLWDEGSMEDISAWQWSEKRRRQPGYS